MLSIAFLTVFLFIAYETSGPPEIEFALACSSTSNPDQLYLGYERGRWPENNDWNVYEVWRSGWAEDGLTDRRRLWVCEEALINRACDYSREIAHFTRLDLATLVLTHETTPPTVFDGTIIQETYQCENISLEMFEQQRHLATLPVQLR